MIRLIGYAKFMASESLQTKLLTALKVNKRTVLKALKFGLIILLVILGIWLLNTYGIEKLRANVARLGIWAPLGVFGLRFISVVIPALPSAAYSILAGSLFGITKGFVVIFVADIISCSLSFYLSKRYGRSLVRRLVGDRFMGRVDKLTQQHLESNFFLMSGFLMTGLFDFVCYAVGLTNSSPKKFIPALLLSIVIARPPIVALGAGVSGGGQVLLIFAVLGAFALAIITGIVQRKQQKKEASQKE